MEQTSGCILGHVQSLMQQTMGKMEIVESNLERNQAAMAAATKKSLGQLSSHGFLVKGAAQRLNSAVLRLNEGQPRTQPRTEPRREESSDSRRRRHREPTPVPSISYVLLWLHHYQA